MRLNFQRRPRARRLLAAALGTGVAAAGATACADSASFQEGDGNGYAGTQDTWFSNRTNGESNGFPEGSFVRTAMWTAANQQALIRFDGAVGGSGVPLGSTINGATLTLHVPTDITYANGEQNAVHQMLVDWVETDAFAAAQWVGGASGGIDLDGVEAAATAADTSPLGIIAQGTTFSLDVTSIVQNWSDGDSNYGFLLQSLGLNAGDGLFMVSSEYTGADGIGARPLLSVDYTPIPEPSTIVMVGVGIGVVLMSRRHLVF